LPPQADEAGLTGHAVIVGYGRVGSVVGSGLKSQGLAVVVVEQNRRAVEELRSRGVAAIYGNASTPGVLEAARIDHARLVVIASPEELETRRIIELAREKNAAIDIAVRTHCDSELAHLEQQQVGIAIMGERELAFGLLGYALRSLGIAKDQARQIVQRARKQDDADGSGRPEAPAGAAPELRPHREPDVGPVG
jgi:CPA2 family monovalent cation:H+ antiporter-2